MAINYKFQLDMGQLSALRGIITSEVFPLLTQAVSAVAQATQSRWMEAVYREKLWSGEKDAYAGSITWKMTGDFSAVVEASYDQAAAIETGRPGRDLKKMLDTSAKVRRTKDGRRFLVIPFRHNTPGNDGHRNAMPESVYAVAKNMAPSSVVGQGKRASGETTFLSPKTGMTAGVNQTAFASSLKTKKAMQVTRNNYSWGDRLKKNDMPKAGNHGPGMPENLRKRYAGMVRFNTGGGGAAHSNYFTFRIMMEGSPKWVTQAQAGKFIAQKVEQDMQPLAEQAFAEAVKRTFT